MLTVSFLITPYLIFPNDKCVYALITMIIIVICIIFIFTYYVSVAKSLPFRNRFFEMVSISLTVAGISFFIGILVKNFLGIDI